MPNILITATNQKDFPLLVELIDNGFISKRSPLSMEVPLEDQSKIVSRLGRAAIRFKLYSIAPTGKLQQQLIDIPDPPPRLAAPNKTTKRQYKEYFAWGEWKTSAEWFADDRCRVCVSTLWNRIAYGWTFEKALGTPPRVLSTRNPQVIEAFGESKTFSEWAEDSRCKVSRSTLWQRVTRLGWSVEKSLATPYAVPNIEEYRRKRKWA